MFFGRLFAVVFYFFGILDRLVFRVVFVLVVSVFFEEALWRGREVEGVVFWLELCNVLVMVF